MDAIDDFLTELAALQLPPDRFTALSQFGPGVTARKRGTVFFYSDPNASRGARRQA